MLVNKRLKMVFMHAPKCAGITLSHWLTAHYGFVNHTNPDLKCPNSGLVERHRCLLPEDCEGCRIITCIREPFERWESFYLYQSLQMGVYLTFEQFTRERLTWLPLQAEYTRHAAYILRADDLAEEVKKLPFVEDPVPPIPRLNVARQMPGYERVKQQVVWTDEIRELVRERFQADFDLIGN